MTFNIGKNLTRRNLIGSLAAVAGVSALAPKSSAATLSAAPEQSTQGSNQSRLSPAARKQATEQLLNYFSDMAPKLLRQPEGLLVHPCIAITLPGKEYSSQLWDWDTLYTGQALFQLTKLTGNKDLHAQLAVHVQGSLFNFLEHQSVEGKLPIMLTANNPDVFQAVKHDAPYAHNQAKPVMAQLALLIADELQDVQWLASRFDQILRFHDSWTINNKAANGLIVWSNDLGIGDDNDPTTFGRPPYSSANMLLNCLFYQELLAAAELAKRLNRAVEQKRYTQQASDLAAAIQKYCWDQRDSFYYTVDVQCIDHTASYGQLKKESMKMSWNSIPLKIQMFTGFLPLWCGFATKEQAKDLLQANYFSDQRFRADAGVRSLSNLEPMYALDFSSAPSNWLGPVWIIANYFVWKGLKQYGYTEAAAELADKTIQTLSADLTKNGSLDEYYHPETGAPLSHHGFLDWNMLVLEMF